MLEVDDVLIGLAHGGDQFDYDLECRLVDAYEEVVDTVTSPNYSEAEQPRALRIINALKENEGFVLGTLSRVEGIRVFKGTTDAYKAALEQTEALALSV